MSDRVTDEPTQPDPAELLAQAQEQDVANAAELARLQQRCVTLRVHLNSALARVAELETKHETDAAVDD